MNLPAPKVPEGSPPELVAMNEALWAWINTGSFQVKAALLQCMDDHDPEARLINRYAGDMARAWGILLETLGHLHPCHEEHDEYAKD